jgi:hypothetical protein
MARRILASLALTLGLVGMSGAVAAAQGQGPTLALRAR